MAKINLGRQKDESLGSGFLWKSKWDTQAILSIGREFFGGIWKSAKCAQ